MNPFNHVPPLWTMSRFFYALLWAVEALTLAALYRLQLLPLPWLLLMTGGMGLADLLLYALLFGYSQPSVRWWGCGLCLLAVTACLTGAYAGYLLEDTIRAVVDPTIGTTDAHPHNPTEEPFAVYLSGSDTRSTALTKSRSDVNILAVVDPAEKQILLVNTPRDYYLPNPAGNGAKDKLTHCGLYGVGNSAQALSVLYGIPIAYTAQINFKGFELLVDSMGGIPVTSEHAFTTSVGGYPIAAGENLLTGAQALAFARERSRLPDGDNGRGRNQMQVITGMIRRLTTGNLLTNYKTVMSNLEGMFTTSMPAATMSRLIRMQLTDLARWEVYTYAVTGSNGQATTWSTGRTKVYVMYPDEATVTRASSLMKQVLRGERLSPLDFAE